MNRPLPRTLLYIAFLLFFWQCKLSAQCNTATAVSSCGYSVTVRVTPTQIIPASMSCAGGYNYNVRFTYTVTITGTNSCSNGNVGVQPQIFCNGGQNNGYYTITMTAPSNGAAFNTYNYTGTLATTSNPYTSASDCATATPASRNCNSMQFTMFGPGISASTYPCSIALPISLLDFNAYFENHKVVLKWSTASEKNNRFFTIERSSDGLRWESITTREGAGTTDTKRDYEVEDRHFKNGLNYYRLKQTDLDGSYQYSGIVFVNAMAKDISSAIYPNPFTSHITIENSGGGITSISVLDQLGEALLVEQTPEERYRMDLSILPAGIYFLRLHSLSSEDYYKIIKY